MSTVHPTAIVHPGAQVGAGSRIGAYAVIGADVVLGADTTVDSHAIVEGPTRMGDRNRVHSFAVLGGGPQRRADSAEPTGALVIGNDNVFREHVTVHRGSAGDTVVGSRCLVMAGAHLAHDVVLGNDIVLANLVQLAGHVLVEDHVVFGGMAGVAQRVRVGEGAFVAAGSMCERDIPPFVIVQGDRARVRGINQVGLKRRGVSAAERLAIQRAYRRIYVSQDRAPFPADANAQGPLHKFLSYHSKHT